MRRLHRIGVIPRQQLFDVRLFVPTSNGCQDANSDHVATNAIVRELLERLHQEGGLPLGNDRGGKFTSERACLAVTFLSAVNRMQKRGMSTFILRDNRTTGKTEPRSGRE